MFGQIENYLCQMTEYLRQLVTLLGGSPSVADAPRYTLGVRKAVFATAGPPAIQIVPPNPRRANLVLGNIGPGDLFISGAVGDRDGFPVFAGMVLSFPGITEPVYGFANEANTTVYYLEVVQV